jgi:hypothetical protein
MALTFVVLFGRFCLFCCTLFSIPGAAEHLYEVFTGRKRRHGEAAIARPPAIAGVGIEAGNAEVPVS